MLDSSLDGTARQIVQQQGTARARNGIVSLQRLIEVFGRESEHIILIPQTFMWGQNEAKRSWTAIKQDARKQISVNAGYPESAMAGALNIRLAGPRDDGEQKAIEWIGIVNEGSTANATDKDIDRGLSLYVNACLLIIAAIVCVTVLIAHT